MGRWVNGKRVRKVPCGACHACCQWDAIIIHPELGDDELDYETVEWNGKRKLASKENGDCVYLDRKMGCTIHGRAPAVCQKFDCRPLFKKAKKDKQLAMFIGDRILNAARRLKRKRLRG